MRILDLKSLFTAYCCWPSGLVLKPKGIEIGYAKLLAILKIKFTAKFIPPRLERECHEKPESGGRELSRANCGPLCASVSKINNGRIFHETSCLNIGGMDPVLLSIKIHCSFMML